jgi:hypothetical protein
LECTWRDCVSTKKESYSSGDLNKSFQQQFGILRTFYLLDLIGTIIFSLIVYK